MDSMKPKCVLIGAGGHAKVLIDSLLNGNSGQPVALIDSRDDAWGTEIFGVPIVGGDDMIPQLREQGVTHFTVAFGSLGKIDGRLRAWNLCLSHGLQPLTVIHPSSVLSRFSEIGRGSHLMPATAINAAVSIGECCIINTGAVVEHDCQIGDFVHIASGAVLAGGVKVGRGAHIGAGASVRQGIVIGEGAVIGAGAAVVKDVDPKLIVGGVPAKVLDINAKS